MAEYQGKYKSVYNPEIEFETDYIAREAARDLMYHKQGPLTEYDLNDLPPADVRPVVLCKDCDLWNECDSSGRKSLGNYRCSCAEWTTEITTYYTGPDEFCSRGERKGGDADGDAKD